jgi:hypothetical protein
LGLWLSEEAVQALAALPNAYEDVIEAGTSAAARLPTGYESPERDAFQHCVAACEATQAFGSGTAAAGGWFRELTRAAAFSQTTGDFFMDLANNSAGFGAAGSNECVDCEVRCRGLLDKGGLTAAGYHQGSGDHLR